MQQLQATMDGLVVTKTARILAIGSAYDDETRHGRDAAKQAAWVTKVTNWEAANKVTWP
jgi:hypothetical protein